MAVEYILKDARESGEGDIEAILAEILSKEEQKAVVSGGRTRYMEMLLTRFGSPRSILIQQDTFTGKRSIRKVSLK